MIRLWFWLREHLFAGPVNTLLTFLSLILIYLLVVPLLEWAFVDVVWEAASAKPCRKTSGACWAAIGEKYRLIIFGRYPLDEHWRPLAASLCLVSMVVLSLIRYFWRASLLLVIWIGGNAAFLGLMWGGFLGLAFVENALWGGLPLTLMLATFGCFLSFPLAILLALGRRSHMPVIRAACTAFIELVRGVPLITVLFVAAFMFPLFTPVGVNVDELLRAQIGIILFQSAYLAEAIRGGLQSVQRGQIEAAQALGMGYWQMTLRIILPQAIKVAIPSIVNSFISLFKDTSLVSIVNLSDLLLSTRLAIADVNWRSAFIEGYVFIAMIYFIFCFSMSRYSQYLEASLGGERKVRQ